MVPFFKIILSLLGLLQVIACLALTSPFRSGFHLPDSVEELTLKYKALGNLILLPVSINNNLPVNLILDTGTRNLVLFGKQFEKQFQFQPDKKVQFSGLGAGGPIFGQLSINNKVAINSVMGLDIPVVVVPNKNLFGNLVNVHGVIGYEIFLKFEIEINPILQEITFRNPIHTNSHPDFVRIPLAVKDSRPILDCEIFMTHEQKRLCDLMIDTGSAFGLLVKATDIRWAVKENSADAFGRGFNGAVKGFELTTQRIQLNNMSIDAASIKVIQSPWHNYASVGMDLLKDYKVIINYCQGYVELKKIGHYVSIP
jgi:aspartyl protease